MSQLGEDFMTVGPRGVADWLGVTMRPEFLDMPRPAEALGTEETLRRHTHDNGLRRWSRRGSCRLVHAALSGRTGRESFYVGDPARWYGQALVRSYNAGADAETATVRTVTLSSLLRSLEDVDLVDVDVQGAELEILAEAVPWLDRVRRLYVETHSETVHRELAVLLAKAGLEPTVEIPLGAERETPFGPASFDGGGVLDCRRQ
jgi:FkbM family methyltransferase